MKFLFICAHPDDLEFSVPSLIITISGNPDMKGLNKKERSQIIETIKKGRSFITKDSENEEFEIKVACMTRGEMSPLTKQIGTLKAAHIRTKELNNSQEILTGGKPDFLGFFDGYIRVTDKSISQIKEYIRKQQPDYIIAPEAWITWYHHPDHIRTGLIVYYALRRLIDEKNENQEDIVIPKLFFFQTLWNDWYFPKYSSYKPIIDKARNAHKSQAGILGLARIPEFIEVHSHIGKFNHPKSEGLRYQPLPDNKHKKFLIKSLNNASFFKKLMISLFYYLKSDRIEHYEMIFHKNYTGRMPPKITLDWYGKKQINN